MADNEEEDAAEDADDMEDAMDDAGRGNNSWSSGTTAVVEGVPGTLGGSGGRLIRDIVGDAT